MTSTGFSSWQGHRKFSFFLWFKVFNPNHKKSHCECPETKWIFLWSTFTPSLPHWPSCVLYFLNFLSPLHYWHVWNSLADFFSLTILRVIDFCAYLSLGINLTVTLEHILMATTLQWAEKKQQQILGWRWERERAWNWVLWKPHTLWEESKLEQHVLHHLTCGSFTRN